MIGGAPIYYNPLAFGLTVGVTEADFIIPQLVTSLVMGSIALLAIRKRGTNGLLFRPLIGMVISLAVLGWLGAWLYIAKEPERRARNLSEQLIGEWTSTVRSQTTTVTMRLTLRSDGTAAWSLDAPATLDIPSHWQVTVPTVRTKSPIKGQLTLKFDKPVEGPTRGGSPSRVEQRRWEIVDVTPTQAHLGNVTEDGRVVVQIFDRAK